jgi:nicotinamide mononucleotide transporter
LSPLELFAVVFGILYLGLISFHQRIGWFFGCLSSIIYVIFCAQQELYIQSVLQFVYVILGVYGFLNWNKNNDLRIIRISIKKHLSIILLGFIFSLFLGKFMSTTEQKSPYLDAFVSVFSAVATILATRSIFENWAYWLVVNVLSIILFWTQGLQMTTCLCFIYFAGSIFGYYNWKKIEDSQSHNLL